MPDNGIAVERREAQGPCAKGLARLERDSKPRFESLGAQGRPIARLAQGASQASGASRRSIPSLFERTEKRARRTRRL